MAKQATKRKAILTGDTIPRDRRIRRVLKKVNGKPVRALPHDYGNWLSHKVVVRTRQAQVLKLYAAGKTPEEIAVMLQMRVNIVTRDINVAIDRMIKEYAQPSPEVTFVRYAAFQLGIVDKLQDAVEQFKNDPKATQYNALVTALKNQSDIYDKVLNKGQELNVVTRKKAKGSVRATATDLRATIQKELITLERLSREIDDTTQVRGLRQGATTDGDLQTSITYVARIRKVERNAFGIVRAIPDWKYRGKKVFDSKGNFVKEEDRTQEQTETNITHEEDKALQLRKKFYESRGIAYIETTDGKLVPFDPTRDPAP